MKTAFDILSEHTCNAGNGALDCDDKVSDMTVEIETAMEHYASQQSTELLTALEEAKQEIERLHEDRAIQMYGSRDSSGFEEYMNRVRRMDPYQKINEVLKKWKP